MVVIKSAYYGDEKSSVNVTEHVLSQVKDGKLKLTANESLYPPTDVGTKIELTAEDQKNIRAEALQKCNAADQRCMEGEMTRLRQKRFEEKDKEAVSSTPIIKGRRLVINYAEGFENRQKSTIVPDGQVIELENVRSLKPPKFTFKDFTDMVWQGLQIGVGVFIITLVFIIPFKLFKDEGSSVIAWGTVGSNLLAPYVGSFLTFIKYFWQGWTSDKNTPKQ